MTNKPLLSICIPTYNRAEFLRDALDSIVGQINENNKDKIGICISDNASEDNTEELVNEYQEKLTVPIIYYKNEKNMGADYNYLKVAEIANGKYFWWLGSDDIIEEGGIDRLIEEINHKDTDISAYIISRNVYDFNMEKVLKNSPVVLNKYLEDRIIDDIDKFLECFVYYGYISAMVINKDRWQNILKNEKNIEEHFNAYVHIYIISKIFKKYGNFKYIGTRYIGCRSENDSFLEKGSRGIIKRAYIDLHGYENIARNVFGKNSIEYKKALTPVSLFMRNHVWHIKRKIKSIREPLNFYIDCIKTYYFIPLFWMHVFPYMMMPRFIYMLGRLFYNKLKI